MLTRAAFTIAITIAMLFAATAAWRAAPVQSAVTVTVDTRTTYQTIEGWGGALPNVTFEAWIKNPTPENYDQLAVRDLGPDALRDKVLDAAIFDLGLNRFRLEVGPQVLMQNDNDDPNTINWDAFRFTRLATPGAPDRDSHGPSSTRAADRRRARPLFRRRPRLTPRASDVSTLDVRLGVRSGLDSAAGPGILSLTLGSGTTSSGTGGQIRVSRGARGRPGGASDNG